MSSGANAFLTKNISPKEIENAIIKVANKGRFLDNESLEIILSKLSGETNLIDNKIHFSDRELVVLRALCMGKTEKEIAASLNLSRSTVHFHRMKLYRKIDCRNLHGLMRFAYSNGYLVNFGL